MAIIDYIGHMVSCIFCQIIAGKLPADIVYQDDFLIVFPDIKPKADIHLLLVPRKHIVNLKFITELDKNLIFQITKLLPKLADKYNLATGFRTIINTGRGGGQEIDHLHYHLIGSSSGQKLVGF